jgi:hypothetical protein
MTEFETRLLNLLKDTRDQLFNINDSIYDLTKTIEIESEHLKDIDAGIFQQTQDSTLVDTLKDLQTNISDIAKILKNKKL